MLSIHKVLTISLNVYISGCSLERVSSANIIPLSQHPLLKWPMVLQKLHRSRKCLQLTWVSIDPPARGQIIWSLAPLSVEQLCHKASFQGFLSSLGALLGLTLSIPKCFIDTSEIQMKSHPEFLYSVPEQTF